MPEPFTVAILVFAEVYVTLRPSNAFPFESSVAAANVVVLPLAIVIALGVTVTVAIAAGSVGPEQLRMVSTNRVNSEGIL